MSVLGDRRHAGGAGAQLPSLVRDREIDLGGEDGEARGGGAEKEALDGAVERFGGTVDSVIVRRTFERGDGGFGAAVAPRGLETVAGCALQRPVPEQVRTSDSVRKSSERDKSYCPARHCGVHNRRCESA